MFDRKIYFSASNNAETYIYEKYMTKFFLSDNTDIDRIWTGRIISILKNWITNRSIKLTDIFRFNLNSVFIVILSFFFIGSKSITFLGVAIVILILIFFWIKYFWPKALKWRKKMKDTNTELDRQVVRQIMSKFEILQSNKISSEISKYNTFINQVLLYRNKEKFWQWVAYDWSNLFAWFLRAAIITVIWYGIFQHTSDLSEFVLFVTLTWILVATIEDLSDVWRKFADALVHVEKLWDVFDALKVDHKWNTWKTFSYNIWDIIIDNLWFSYISWKHIFENFSLDLKWWTKTAFVGESWWGKTTLIKLLAGYLRPDSGEIIIDGQKLTDVKLTDYYRHIGYLTQDPNVFDGTIYENLTYALEDNHGENEKREKDIHEVIKLAKCEFIYDFEYGLQTEIGERGVRLSGWQKQRLAIAKIMLKNPNIILLDEPTSALDSFNEELISEALNNLFKWKTVIVAAHRLQTVKNADRILYIEWWKVIEDGTHTSLIKKNGKYKKMLDLQSGF